MRLEDFYINANEFYTREIEKAKKQRKKKLILTIAIVIVMIGLYLIGLFSILKGNRETKQEKGINILPYIVLNKISG